MIHYALRVCMKKLYAYTKNITAGFEHKEFSRWLFINGKQVIYLSDIDLPSIKIDEDEYTRCEQFDLNMEGA